MTPAPTFPFSITYHTTDGRHWCDQIRATSWCRASAMAKEISATLDGIIVAIVGEEDDTVEHFEHEVPIL